ncbi:DUF6443 domain-containing protein [Chryseobacterium sp.]|uniref:DUF6443 domain-containing protein n=1 Tax=Chryseobacterium sp. TaxID=1871047 RepID=UPI0025C14B08|nr:DUF6443 domain-containing protein [Chryseobacterium sp.]
MNLLHSQTLTENFVATSDCLDVNCNKKTETVKYFDGLGKIKQIVSVKSSPSEKDIVIPLEYDGYGRSVKNYLPIPQQTSGNGNIFSDPFSYASTIYSGEKYYSEIVLEISPLNRTQQQKSVGNEWNNHPVKIEYGTNSIYDAVRKFVTNTNWINNATSSVITYSNEYAVGKLYKTISIDEDNNRTIIFKNSLGQNILIRKVLSSTINIDTYYVYNEYDQLAFVIPAKALDEFFNNYGAGTDDQIPEYILNDLCYQYHFDGKNRLVEKRLPGKSWEYLIYDKQNRVVLVQDANLGSSKQWIFTKYDEFGRDVYSGIYTSTQNYGSEGRVYHQNIVDGKGINNTFRTTSVGFTDVSGMGLYYTNDTGSYPNTNIKVHSVNYYDSYPQYNFNPAFPFSIKNEPVLTDTQLTDSRSTKSLPVMSLVKNIEDDNWTKSYTYYDKKGRIIGQHSINHLGGFTRVENLLDFSGVPQTVVTTHARLALDPVKTITETFEYDDRYRLKKHWHQVDQYQPELLTDNTYNELSQITNKKVGNSLESIDYTYNIRGWVTAVNNPLNLTGKLFGYKLKYTNPEYTTITSGKYNGNIAEVDWATSKDGIVKRYSYQYDALNRLKKGFYSEPGTDIPQNEYYNEVVDYDLNGNISSLSRNRKMENVGKELMDNLTYFYTGNKLNRITDSSANYFGYPDSAGNQIHYDNNGNMTDHIDRGMLEIKYNFLDLPDYIKFDEYVLRDDPFFGGTTTQYKNTNYLYRADGTKLKKVHNYFSGRNQADVSKTTEYLDGFQYNFERGLNAAPLNTQGLQFVPTSEGYYDFVQNKYIYQYKDQVGNVRVAFYRGVNGLAQIDRTTDFYPFGLEFGGSSSLSTSGSLSPDYTYSFQEQEKQQETGWYSFKWRNYDPTMARFFNVDPLSEKYAYQSHYNFSENRVIDGTELEGLEFRSMQEANDYIASHPNTTIDWVNEQPIVTTGETLIQEVVIEGHRSNNNAISNNSGNTSGENLAINSPQSSTTPFPYRGPENGQGGGLIMMDSMWDVIGIVIANNMSSENKTAMLGLGALAIILSRGHATDEVLKAELATEKAEMRVLSRTEMSSIWGKGPRIDPQNLPKSVTNDFVEILAGRGEPRMTNGSQTIIQNRSGVNPKWVGAKEWKIKDVPDTMLDGSRILQHPNGKWGLVIDHNYKNIIEIPTNSALK